MIVVCLKWLRPTTGTDPDRFGVMSAADHAALELALQCGEAFDEPVVAMTVGDHGAVAVLRQAIACGARRGIHVLQAAGDAELDTSAALVAAIDTHVPHASTVWCGDYSNSPFAEPTGTPAFIAARRGCGQALGALAVRFDVAAQSFEVVRRLDGGRREHLRIARTCVISVEGVAAKLRRAPLTAMLADPEAVAIVQVSGTAIGAPTAASSATHREQYRPRAKVVAAPHNLDSRQRVRQLIDTGTTARRGEVVQLDPHAGAMRVLDVLRAWGYVTTG